MSITSKKILICWIGLTDLNVAKGLKKVGSGPIANAVESCNFDEICLISNLSKTENDQYVKWLKGHKKLSIYLYPVKLSSPTAFDEIYKAAVNTIKEIANRHKAPYERTYHISPGTPQMAAVWIILAKTKYPADIIESSYEKGVKTTNVPFDISAEFIPDLLSRSDQKLNDLSIEPPPDIPEFTRIIHKSNVMKRVIYKAKYVALRSVHVLIEGDSGTGKELLARAIHYASPRKKNKLVAVNCGAIQKELFESELFGHEKGAFTGANHRKIGLFEKAHGGTLFLDELGELPLDLQVKLLRVIQESKVKRVGSNSDIKIDTRIIAATNKNLVVEVAKNRFRSDLFYRLAVAVLKLPPLTDREGDLKLLMSKLMDQINEESKEEPGYQSKKLTIQAENELMKHDWPGNIRELLNTLRRAAIWNQGNRIDYKDIQDALIPIRREQTPGQDRVLDQPFDDGFNLKKIMANVAHHYLTRALNEAHKNKAQATKLLGFANYQTLTNWLNKYNVSDDDI